MSKEIQKHIQEIFKIQQLLGSGAYGHVWKVIQKSTNEIFALKKVFDAFQNNVDAQRTYRQITILHELNSPHIIKLKSVIKAKNDKDLYLVFQHMQTDLHSLVGQNILEMPHLLYIIYQIFKGLKYLHSAQLIHRDLKPSNVLINSDCEIKLCDFGLVRSMTYEEDSKLVLSEDVATRWYRSPQMLLGSHDYSWATDVWSIGCVLAELIIGEPLLMGGSNIQQLQKILELTGIPKKEDIQSLRSSIGQTLIGQFKTLKKPFKHYFKGCKFQFETKLINLIKSMLEFNPEKRITVDEVLRHELFAQIRCENQEPMCKKFIIPELDDNIRLTVEQYRKVIYKDIQRRYPEYNKDPEKEQQISILRVKRGHNSLISRMSSMDSMHRIRPTNSIMRPTRSKDRFVKNQVQSNVIENKQIQHQSLHCNTVHNSNFYKSAHNDPNQQQENSIYNRKNPFNPVQNQQKIDTKQSTNASTVVQKSPFRRYKKYQINQKSQIKKIQGLCKEKSPEKQNLCNFTAYLSSSKSYCTGIAAKAKTSPKGFVYDPSSIYSNNSPTKGIRPKQKNFYKVMQLSNQNKITKKTFTRARKDLLRKDEIQSKNTSTNFTMSKIMESED